MSTTTRWVVHCDGDFPGCEMKRTPISSVDAAWPRVLADRDGWLHLAEYGDWDLCPNCRRQVFR